LPGWRVERASHGRLDFIDTAGQRYGDVDVLRAFPVSAPAGPVVIVASDGAELAWIGRADRARAHRSGKVIHLPGVGLAVVILKIVSAGGGV
jgi:hypothetical protein